MATASLSIAIVGCGRMGRHHARTCQQLGHRVACLHDADVDRAATLATECRDAEVVVASEDIPWKSIDAVLVCTPPFARGPIELAAIQTGTPFFVEKPIGISSRQCVPVLRALRGRGLVNAVGYMSRYRESVRQARAAIRERPLIGIHAQWLAGHYDKCWWRVPEQSGGPFNEQGTHFVDLCRYFGGEIDAIAATACAGPTHETVSVACRFTTGACGTILYSCRSYSKRMSFTVLCSDAAVELSGYDLAFGETEQSTDSALRVEVETFCRAVTEDRRDLVESDFDDAFQTQLVVDAITESLATGRTTVVGSPVSRPG